MPAAAPPAPDRDRDAVTVLRVGPWHELRAWAQAVRTEVFVGEQGIAVADEWDALDATAIHAVLLDAQERALGTARLLQPAPSMAQIGRMAVTRARRGQGLGARLLMALVEVARARGDREVCLHAQCSAEGFYARLGFAPRGTPYDEVGIPHITMTRRL